jgi:hypothetical protein
MKPSRFRVELSLSLPWQMATGGSSSKGEARGKCIRIFLGRDQEAKKRVAQMLYANMPGIGEC